MNWLFYIGGFPLFWAIWFAILAKAITFKFNNSFSFGAVTFIIILFSIPVLMTWIWICYKFIKI